jgi:hypothetical protein
MAAQKGEEMADRYIVTGGKIDRIFPGGMCYLEQALKEAYNNSLKDQEYHIVESVTGKERTITRVYRQGLDCTYRFLEGEEE